MPEVTDDEVGRRIFQLNRQRHVEKSVEKIRRSLGRAWKLFSPEEVELLKYILGEAWVAMERKEWEACSFTKLTQNDVTGIIGIGKQVKERGTLESSGVEQVSQILRKYI